MDILVSGAGAGGIAATIGRAFCCPGAGTSLALAGMRLLAEEHDAAREDYVAAIESYESRQSLYADAALRQLAR